MEPEAGLVADPDGGLAPELLVPTLAILARCGSIGRSGAARRRRGRRSRSDSERMASRGILSRNGAPAVALGRAATLSSNCRASSAPSRAVAVRASHRAGRAGSAISARRVDPSAGCRSATAGRTRLSPFHGLEHRSASAHSHRPVGSESCRADCCAGRCAACNRGDDRRSEWVGRGLFPHVAGFEFFTGSARAGVVATHLFSNVADRLALLLGRLLAAGDGGVLLLTDAARGRRPRRVATRPAGGSSGPDRASTVSPGS